MLVFKRKPSMIDQLAIFEDNRSVGDGGERCGMGMGMEMRIRRLQRDRFEFLIP